MVRGSDEYREYADGVALSGPSPIVVKPRCYSLPDGFTPFCLSGTGREAPYLSYLRGRGLTDRTVALYRMGYVDSGFLSGRVVVPSFDSLGSINFWSARSIDPDEHLRYRLPLATKDIVSNEHMVDWTRPVYIVEGIFDEVAIGPQAIALYGKTPLPLLMQRLVEHRPPIVHVCLDSDARVESRRLAQRLLGYDIRCSLPGIRGKDPASVPIGEVVRASTSAREISGDVGMIGARL